ncbi:MAG: type II secretion system F family protein [Anaerolineae bacterium]|nr:type II secretion system F family protein [Anaerolineae bacterium]
MSDWILSLALGLLAGGSVLAIVFGIAGAGRQERRVQQQTVLPAIQVRLDKAQLGVSAATYVGRSLLYGVAFGALMAVATGAFLAFFAGLAGGFAFVWARLEDRRNDRLNRYNKALASAADTVVNSWESKPSINRALDAVARWGQGEVADDFGEVVTALRTGTQLSKALQQVADRRQSHVFDAFATALFLAAEQSGEVTDMLARHAESTRQMSAIYEEMLDTQRGQRQDAMWGIVGPWGVLLLLRLGTMFTGGLGYGTEFFATPMGQIAALGAAALTVVAYVATNRTAARGMIVNRVPLAHGATDSPAEEV